MYFNLLTHTISTTRATKGSGIQQTWVTNLRNQACLIQPMSAEMAEKTHMVFEKSYVCYLPTLTDVAVGDMVTDQNGKMYGVAGIKDRQYGNNPNLAVYLNEGEPL